MDKTIIKERLERLREELRREHLSAFIFPTSDPHHSEYTPDHWKGREWISGFDGSAGIAVVTLRSAALWTDSRNFVQAEQQLEGTEFQLIRQGMTDIPAVSGWLERELADRNDKEIGVDGMVTLEADVERLKEEMKRRGGITVRTNFDPLQRIWKDRPAIPRNPVEIQSAEQAGGDARSKLTRIRQALRERHADGMLAVVLDDIAWTLNLRGSDVHGKPVFVAYLLIASNKATLFVDQESMTDRVRNYLKGQGVDVAPYTEVGNGLRDYFEYNILLDPREVCYSLYQKVTRMVVRGASPFAAVKAVWDEKERLGF